MTDTDNIVELPQRQGVRWVRAQERHLKDKERWEVRARKFNTDVAHLKRIAKEQEYKCPICGDWLGKEMQNAHLDHDHGLGYIKEAIRGFLCRPCNVMLHKRDNSIELHINAAQYLMKHLVGNYQQQGEVIAIMQRTLNELRRRR